MIDRSHGKIKSSGIACAGNWILDVVHDISHWPEKSGLSLISAQHTGLGGGPANVACDLAAMGVPYQVVPLGLVGAGALGDEVLRLCREAGLPVERIARTSEAATSQTHVMNLPGDSRTFFYYPGANDLLDPTMIDLAALSELGVRLFYLGYLNLLARLDRIRKDGRTEAAALLGKARSLGMTTCVDLASSKKETYRQTVKGTLAEIDYLFLNEMEAASAAGVSFAGESDVDAMIQAARLLKEGGVNSAVIVHSPTLVVWVDGERERVFQPEPVPPERILSPVGAGDAFAAGVLHGIHEGWSPERSVALGMRAAEACLARYTATDGLAGLSVPRERQ